MLFRSPHAQIAQIAAVWIIEMVAQPDGFMIREKNLTKAIVEAKALIAAVEVVVKI